MCVLYFSLLESHFEIQINKKHYIGNQCYIGRSGMELGPENIVIHNNYVQIKTSTYAIFESMRGICFPLLNFCDLYRP